MEKERYGWWNGRLYVDEKSITPEQYKMFFGKNEFGITFDTANCILKNRAEGFMDEIVPADELSEEAISDIKTQVMDGYMSGTIYCEGQSLNWSWDSLEINMDDGEDTKFCQLSEGTKNHILNCMLDNECHCGEIID